MIYADHDISLDGFTTGMNTSVEQPLGVRGEELIWYGDDVNSESAPLADSYQLNDAQILESSATKDGAVVMGMRTFLLSIAEWGENPPIHQPCFVVTSQPRESLHVSDTTFTFVSSVQDAVQQAETAAKGKDVCVMGGANTIAECLNLGLLDELHLHSVPVLLGDGTAFFENVDQQTVVLTTKSASLGEKATHTVYSCSVRPASVQP